MFSINPQFFELMQFRINPQIRRCLVFLNVNETIGESATVDGCTKSTSSNKIKYINEKYSLTSRQSIRGGANRGSPKRMSRLLLFLQ